MTGISQNDASARAAAGDRMAEPLAGLNTAQRQAVLHHEGPLLVLAGAGSGKTRVLTTRIAHLVQRHGVDPREILAVTFTNKAAGEMRERLARLLGHDPAGMWVGTFHAIGARLLRIHAPLVGRTPSFTIYDEDDALGRVRRIMERQSINAKEWAPKALLSSISDAKNQLVSPREYESLAADPMSRVVAKVYNELEPDLRAQNAATFDDLLVLPVQILRDHADVLEHYRRRFRFILVDEYQDTNRAQYKFITMLAGGHGNVCVVGDDDQSIYGWRGADIRNILDFERDFPKATIVRLEENYRSAAPILEMANTVIQANTGRMGKTLRPTRGGGERVTLVRALDERDEADWVAEEITTRRGASRGLELRHFSVLYRTNSQSRPLEEAFRKRQIPYRLVGAVRFYDRREIRDLVSYLKLIANPADNEAFTRAVAVPKRGIGDTSVDTLEAAARAAGVPMLDAAARPDLVAALRPAARTALAEFARLVHDFRERAKEAAVDELLRDLVSQLRYGDYLKSEGPGWEDRRDNVQALIDSAAETVADEEGEVGLTPLDHFLQRAMLVAGTDQLDPSADAVTMMTIHNAKGLEFPNVFITGLEDGLFPLSKAFDDPQLLEEERRLFYVGITRAERKLYVLNASQRRRNGELMRSAPSRFLRDVPDGMLEERKTLPFRSQGMTFTDSSYGGGFGGGQRYGQRGGGYGSGGFGGRGAERGAERARPERISDFSFDDFAQSAPSPVRRAGRPVALPTAAEDESQLAATIQVGVRVKHRKFGNGTITALTGAGRDAKARIDFDDEEVGQKTLVLAQANLEPADE